MKTHITTASLAALTLLLSSCAGKPVAEAEWNHLKIWQRVGDNPTTYIPSGYAANRPRTEHDGTWFVDKRDGKRLFVPDQKVGEWSPGVLAGEAKKVCDIKPPKAPKDLKDIAEDTASAVLWTVVGVAMAIGQMGH